LFPYFTSQLRNMFEDFMKMKFLCAQMFDIISLVDISNETVK